MKSVFERMNQKPLYKLTKPIRLIELFAGYGTQALALKYANIPYENWFVCEIDKYAVEAYNLIHNTKYEPTDIKSIHADNLNIMDTDSYTYLMTYSFPCTDISVAGRKEGMKKGSSTRSSLLWEVERLLLESADKKALPQLLLMENVPQVIADKNIDDFNVWLKTLEALGYSNYYKVLSATDYGVPQKRKRCFMLSILGNYNYTFPEPKPLSTKLQDLLNTHVDSKYYWTTEKTMRVVKASVKDETSLGADNIIPCQISKPFIDNNFVGMDFIKIRNFNTTISPTLLAHYYKGATSNGDIVVMERTK